MNRINSFVRTFTHIAVRAVPLAIGFFGVTANAVAATGGAAITCTSGTVINDSANGYIPVGCIFTKWGATEMGQCVNQGLTMFGPNNSGSCHICVLPQYASLIANGSATSSAAQGQGSYLFRQSPFLTARLTVDKSPVSYIDGVHTPFRCYQCTNRPVGLSAWWTLDDWATMPAKDATGLTPDGAYYGTTKVLGQSGNAARFNGYDYVEIPNAPSINVGGINDPGKGEFSIAAWVKFDPADATSGVQVIVEKRTADPYSANPYKGYSFYLYNGRLGLQIAPGTAQNFSAPALVVPADGQWHLAGVSVKRIGADIQFFLDGTVVKLLPAAGVPSGSLVNPNPLRIGIGNLPNNWDGFRGSIDEVQFFTRALASSEFQSIFNSKCYGLCKP